MSIAYLIGMAVGIAAAIALVVVALKRGERYQDKNRPSEYDERQKAARGFAALGSLAVGGVDHRRAGGAGRPADADAPG